MNIISLNRILIMLLLLATSAAVAMVFLRGPTLTEPEAQQRPLQVSYKKTKPAEWQNLKISTKNPFSRDGKPWKFEYASTATKSGASIAEKNRAGIQKQDINIEDVNGLVQLPGLSVMMTKTGIIKEGDSFKGGKITSLQQGQVTFEADNHLETVTRVTTGRKPVEQLYMQGFPRYRQKESK